MYKESYIITNTKNSDSYIKEFDDDLNPRDFIINHLDLSLNWGYTQFDDTNKGDLIKYLIIKDNSIKEIDSAIPLNISNRLQELNIRRDNFITVYFKNGGIEIINLIEYYHILKSCKDD